MGQKEAKRCCRVWCEALGFTLTINDALSKRKKVLVSDNNVFRLYCNQAEMLLILRHNFWEPAWGLQLIRTQNRSPFGLIRTPLIALCDVSICKTKTETQSSTRFTSLSRKTITHNLTCSVTQCASSLPSFFCSWLRGTVPGTLSALIKTH